ncbi:hypothetical protein [Sulfitobacter sp.]|uniref:hypothetical protein n=1 Tax=Sulfitobacter sp. TaxID=1903071 RepID=UPI003EF81287
MYSIRNIAEAIEKAVPTDHLSPDEQASSETEKAEYVAQLDKSLRNLSQRVYLPVTELKGRVGLYKRSTVAAFALVVALNDFDVPRHVLQKFTEWLQEPGGPASPMLGNRRASPIEEAVQRLEQGEKFTFEIVGGAFGRKHHRARWDNVEDSELYQLVDSRRPASVILSLPASELIQILFAGLDN